MTDELPVECFCGEDRIEVSVKKSFTDQYTVGGLRDAIKAKLDYVGDPTKIKIYKRGTKDAATDPLTSSIVPEGKPYGSCDYEIELPSSGVNSYHTKLRGSKAEALNLINVPSMHHMELTPTDMKFSGRDADERAMHQVISLLGQLADDLTSKLGDGKSCVALSVEAETQVVTKLRVVIVPAFLYRWASDNAGLPIAEHLQRCLIAVWNRIFLTGDKEGTDGKAFEQFLWHYEAVRRELNGKMSVHKFYYGFKTRPTYWKDKRTYLFPVINAKIPNPSKNMYENFNVSDTCCDVNTRYEPTKSNFPKYDWFTLMSDSTGTTFVKGEQTKHGKGNVAEADDSVVSVKLSTVASDELSDWKEKGWLVLGSDELERYLGSTLSFASICARHIESKRKRDVTDVGREPSTPSEKTHLDSDSSATLQDQGGVVCDVKFVLCVVEKKRKELESK